MLELFRYSYFSSYYFLFFIDFCFKWMAPEVLTGNVYSESADVYSMGIVLWEMLTGQCPYDGMKQVEIALSVVNNQVRPPIPSQCSQEQALFIQVCAVVYISFSFSFCLLICFFSVVEMLGFQFQ
jgi:serine/threonine protein kinase